MRLNLDQDGHLVDYTLWNEQVAQVLAQSLSLELTAWHFEILTDADGAARIDKFLENNIIWEV